MNNTMHYKGYTGSVDFSESDGVFYGKVQGIRSLVSYDGATEQELEIDFHKAVDEFLAACEAEDCIRLKLCDVQGRLFRISTAYASESFIRNFMFSEVARHLDSPYSKLQCVGEEYLLEELEDERNLSGDGEKYDPEVLYWIGYLYRYWACYRHVSSKAIFKTAPAKTMKRNYQPFHALDPDVAIDNLIEIREQLIQEQRAGETV